MNNVSQFKPSLSKQLSEFETKIRDAETELLKLKEGYLKVSGAMELLEILVKEEEEEEKTAASTDEVISVVPLD
jgi:hypothetical protein